MQTSRLFIHIFNSMVAVSEFFLYNIQMTTHYIHPLNKHQLIIRDILCAHNPKYQGREQELMEDWGLFNVERIVEEQMAALGGYDRVDATGYDNSDYSETKTGTVRRHDRTATITSILTERTRTAKVGDIRAVMYNEFTERLDYFFLPKAYWETIREYGKSNSDILRARYSPSTDSIHKWQDHRVDSFLELAVKLSTVSSPYEYRELDTPKNTLFDWT